MHFSERYFLTLGSLVWKRVVLLTITKINTILYSVPMIIVY
jgi:hypothetical protein